MPQRSSSSRSSSVAARTTAATSSLWRLAAALLFSGCVGQQRNDVRAFAFAPSSLGPSLASSSPWSSSAYSALRRGGGGGGGDGAGASSHVHRLAARGAIRQQQQQQCSSTSASSFWRLARKTSCSAVATAVAPLRAVEDGGGEAQGSGEGGQGGGGEGEEISSSSSSVDVDAGGAEEASMALPEIVNPFKLAYDAGQKLRSTLANTLEQITGTAGPVSCIACVCPADETLLRTR